MDVLEFEASVENEWRKQENIKKKTTSIKKYLISSIFILVVLTVVAIVTKQSNHKVK